MTLTHIEQLRVCSHWSIAKPKAKSIIFRWHVSKANATLFYNVIHKAAGLTVPGHSMILPGTIPETPISREWSQWLEQPLGVVPTGKNAWPVALWIELLVLASAQCKRSLTTEIAVQNYLHISECDWCNILKVYSHILLKSPILPVAPLIFLTYYSILTSSVHSTIGLSAFDSFQNGEKKVWINL